MSVLTGRRWRSALHDRHGWPLAAVRPDYRLYRLNDGALQVHGHRSFPCSGPIYGTAYFAELRPTTRQVFTHMLDPQATLLPRRRLTGEQSVEEFEAGGGAEAMHAREAAVAAAGALLGRSCEETGDGAEVVGVRSDTVGVTMGDVIVAVDGAAVRTARTCAALLDSRNRATLTVTRPGTTGEPGVVDVRLSRHRDRRWGLRTVTRSRRLTLPFDVVLRLPGGVGGPSMGLAIALSLLDQLSPGSLTGGAAVAATGALGIDGTVHPVGGVALKARAVAAHGQVPRFVVPAGDHNEVARARQVLGRRVEVIPVGSLRDAVAALEER